MASSRLQNVELARLLASDATFCSPIGAKRRSGRGARPRCDVLRPIGVQNVHRAGGPARDATFCSPARTHPLNARVDLRGAPGITPSENASGTGYGKPPARCTSPGRSRPSTPGEPLGHADQRVEVDAGDDALALEQVDEVLGRDVARGARRERAAAQAADRRVEQLHADVEPGDGVRVARVARVVQVQPDRHAAGRDLGGADEPAHLARHADADRVGEHDLVGARGGHPRGVVDHDPRVDAPLERAAERDAERGRRPQAGVVRGPEHRHGVGRRLRDGGVLVARGERVRQRVGEMRLARARGDRAVEALRVEHERGERGSAAAVEPREHLLGAGHLGHEPGVHEARRLDAAQPGGGEPAAQLGARGRLEHRGVVLQAVARAHVAERDHRRAGYPRPGSTLDRSTTPLSLPAELLLLSFDPATRRLYRVRRGRLEVALVAADGGDAEGSRLGAAAARARRAPARARRAAGGRARRAGPHAGARWPTRAALARRYDAARRRDARGRAHRRARPPARGAARRDGRARPAPARPRPALVQADGFTGLIPEENPGGDVVRAARLGHRARSRGRPGVRRLRRRLRLRRRRRWRRRVRRRRLLGLRRRTGTPRPLTRGARSASSAEWSLRPASRQSWWYAQAAGTSSAEQSDVVQPPAAAVAGDAAERPARLARRVAVQRAERVGEAELAQARHDAQLGLVPGAGALRAEPPAPVARERPDGAVGQLAPRRVEVAAEHARPAAARGEPRAHRRQRPRLDLAVGRVRARGPCAARCPATRAASAVSGHGTGSRRRAARAAPARRAARRCAAGRPARAPGRRRAACSARARSPSVAHAASHSGSVRAVTSCSAIDVGLALAERRRLRGQRLDAARDVPGDQRRSSGASARRYPSLPTSRRVRGFPLPGAVFIDLLLTERRKHGPRRRPDRCHPRVRGVQAPELPDQQVQAQQPGSHRAAQVLQVVPEAHRRIARRASGS